jgi:Co/Zn/Cd efflux system component
MPTGFRRTLSIVAFLNLAYFGVESAAAVVIGSVSLLADSIDFLEDAALNGLILIAAGWSARSRSTLAKLLAVIILVPGLATLWMTWQKIALPVPPAPLPLSATGAGALIVNLTCALLLMRFRHHGGSLGLAAFLSARNDVLANAAIIAAGVATTATQSVWPDITVGLVIAAMNAGAAAEVYRAAGRETAPRA